MQTCKCICVHTNHLYSSSLHMMLVFFVLSILPAFKCLYPLSLSLYAFSFRMKYIETELKKKKGMVEAEELKVKVKNPEDLLYELPENIRVSSAKKTEEMLSNQMLSGIPEVDLGIE